MAKIENHFKTLVGGILTVKLLLAYYIPITADEAYFWVWGQHPDINYYDHPPVTGWVVALFSLPGNHIFFSRLFAVASGAAVAWGIYLIARDAVGFRDRARLISLAYLACPLHLLLVLITTDTPVFLLVFFSAMAFHFSLKRRKASLMILAGALCGLAILSKYFAGLLAIAFLTVLAVQRRPRRIVNALLLLVGALPFVLFHLYGNYTTCWTNVLFNVYNRNRDVSWHVTGLLLFLGFQVYLATPWLLYQLGRNIKPVIRGLRNDGNVFGLLFLVPMLLFALVSFHDTGLHWTLAFIPFLYIPLIYLRREAVAGIAACSLVFSLVHLLVIAAALTLPIDVVRDKPYYNDVVMAFHGPEIHKALRARYGKEILLATNGYYTSSAMSYHGGEHYIVFLDDSKHGRYDDKLTDFRLLDGEDILSLRTLPVDEDYSPYFASVRVEELTIHGGTFYVVIGKGFRYTAYRDQFLDGIRKRLYNIPDYLPTGPCYFFDKYFDDARPATE